MRICASVLRACQLFTRSIYFDILGRMEQKEAIQKLRGEVNKIAATVTAMHPLVPGLADPPTQAELLKALYELTKNVEVVKKQLLKLEKRDDSALL
jgi:hypothetical protein